LGLNINLEFEIGTGTHPYFPQDEMNFLFESGKVGCINDGYQKGFHFRNTEEAQLFYNIWNEAIVYLLESTYEKKQNSSTIPLHEIGDGRSLWSQEFIASNVMHFFRSNLNYKHLHNVVMHPGDTYLYKEDVLNPYHNQDLLVARHRPKPEDNLYYGPMNGRGAWYNSNFDYINKESISHFIKNNKEELKKYYEEYRFDVEVTDTHIYPKIPII
jgi:hypothetical protein